MNNKGWASSYSDNMIAPELGPFVYIVKKNKYTDPIYCKVEKVKRNRIRPTTFKSENLGKYDLVKEGSIYAERHFDNYYLTELECQKECDIINKLIAFKRKQKQDLIAYEKSLRGE